MSCLLPIFIISFIEFMFLASNESNTSISNVPSLELANKYPSFVTEAAYEVNLPEVGK